MDRVVSDASVDGLVHRVTLVGLEPATSYACEVTVSGRVLQRTLTTAQTGFGASRVVWGRVVQGDGVTPAVGVLVYLWVMGRQGASGFLSGMTDGEGFWVMNLGNLKDPTTGEVFVAVPEQRITVLAYGGTQGRATLEAVVTEEDLQLIGGELIVERQEETAAERPWRFLLEQNAPNPFNAGTVIEYQVPAMTHVVLRLYDLTGQVVRTLVDRTEVAGVYRVRWDGRDAQGREVASGIYSVRLQAETASQWSEGRQHVTATRKMVLMR